MVIVSESKWRQIHKIGGSKFLQEIHMSILNGKIIYSYWFIVLYHRSNIFIIVTMLCAYKFLKPLSLNACPDISIYQYLFIYFITANHVYCNVLNHVMYNIQNHTMALINDENFTNKQQSYCGWFEIAGLKPKMSIIAICLPMFTARQIDSMLWLYLLHHRSLVRESIGH